MSQVRYLCLNHYVLTTDLFGVSVQIFFREEVKRANVFFLVETVSVKLSESGIPLKNFHVTDIPVFDDKDEKIDELFLRNG